MRRLAVLLVILWMGLPACGARLVTADQLDQILRGTRGDSDGKIARRLGSLELREPVGGARLAQWERTVPGEKSRRALSLLVDVAAFRDARLSSAGAASRPDSPPEMEMQRHIFRLSVDYVAGMLPRLPDFRANRKIEYYEEFKPVGEDGAGTPALYESLHVVGNSSDTVFYRDGKEVVDAAPARSRAGYEGNRELETRGVFGPILGVVVSDALHGRLVWGRWALGDAGPEAVFRFTVPRARSHYQVFCCMSSGSAGFRENPAYHGEVAVDPVTGTVLRLLIVADMERDAPVRESGILVEYGPVSIGGSIYICPQRSVSLAVEWEPGSRVRRTSLNDVVFSDYHRFGTESKILTGDAVETP